MKHKLKHILLTLLTVTTFLTTLPSSVTLADTTTPSAGWPEPPEITSAAAVVIEASTGSVLYNKNAYDAYHPASTTKLLTSHAFY